MTEANTTPTGSAMLKEWQSKNAPSQHIEKLCDLQDFLCYLLMHNPARLDNEVISGFLMDIVSLKNDLKLLGPKNCG